MSSVKKAKAGTTAIEYEIEETPPASEVVPITDEIKNWCPETMREEALLVQLEMEKQRHRQFREESCLDELQSVLERRNCSLSALPDGRFQVVWKG